MKVLLTGATGFIGKRLARALNQAGHELVFIGRDPERARAQIGLPGEYRDWEAPLPEGSAEIDAVVHLAGESVSAKRWTAEVKARLVESRIATTRQLVEAFHGRAAPKVWINASAVGFYGDRGDEPLNEKSPGGTGFLAYLCQDWEAESARIQLEHGTRWVSLRIGMVLAREGGALPKLAPLFALGLGGPLGSGKQWMSWIHAEDLVRLIEFALVTPALQGPVNAVAPAPVQNKQFGRLLGKALKRPAILPAPRLAIETLLGEQSAIALDSQRVAPEKALAAGFQFKFGSLDGALDNLFQGRAYSLWRG